MFAVLIGLVVVLLVAATVMDARARRHGHRVRGGGDIAGEIRPADPAARSARAAPAQ